MICFLFESALASALGAALSKRGLSQVVFYMYIKGVQFMQVHPLDTLGYNAQLLLEKSEDETTSISYNIYCV